MSGQPQFKSVKSTIRPSIRWILALLFAISANFVSAAPPDLHIVSPLRLSSLGYDDNRLCGTKAETGEAICLQGAPKPVPTYTNIRQMLVNSEGACLVDGHDFNCWGYFSGFQPRADLARYKGQVDRVVAWTFDSFCFKRLDGSLVCVGNRFQGLSGWRQNAVEFAAAAVEDMKSFAIVWDGVCGLKTDGKVDCLLASDSPRVDLPEDQVFAEIASDGFHICARTVTSVFCSDEQGEVPLFPQPSLTPTSHGLVIGRAHICWLDQGKIDCVTTNASSTGPSVQKRPIEPLDLRFADVDYTIGCGLNSRGAVICWGDLATNPPPADLGEGWEHLSVTTSTTCVARQDRLRCWGDSPDPDFNNPPLKASAELQVVIGPYMICAANPDEQFCLIADRRGGGEGAPRHPVAASGSWYFGCALDRNATGLNEVRCWNGTAGWRLEPKFAAGAKLLATTADALCAGYDEFVRCKIGEDVLDLNVSGPQKLAMSEKKMCSIDRFGLMCWAIDASAAELADSIPAELREPGAVIDLALRENATCVLTATAQVRCWTSEGELELPPLQNPTSIYSTNRHICVSEDRGLVCFQL